MLFYSGENCLDCGHLLKFSDNKATVLTVFSSHGSSEIKHHVKVCTKMACRNHYHYTYFTRKNVHFKEKKLAKFFYEHATKNSIFMLSSITAFTVAFLISMLTDMMLCPEYSFQQKATAFNLSVLSGNTVMNKQRLIEAFMLFALLEMLKTYQPELRLSTCPFSFNLDENLLKFTPSIKDSFQKLHAKHSCAVPGCRLVIGWDADCKVIICECTFDDKLFRMNILINYTDCSLEMRLSNRRDCQL